MPFKRSMPCKTFSGPEEFRLLLLVRWRSNMPPHCWDAAENRISFPKQTRPIGFHYDSDQGLSFPMIFNVLKVQLDQAENGIKFGRGCQATGFSRESLSESRLRHQPISLSAPLTDLILTSQWSDQCPLSASRNGVKLIVILIVTVQNCSQSYPIYPGSERVCKLLAFSIYFHALSLTRFFGEKMHFGRLCKLRVRQWTVNPSPALTTVWSPHSLWSVSPYWFQTGNSMSVTQCCHYKCVSEYQSL